MAIASAGFWHRLLNLVGARPEPEPVSPPPLFRLRPVPPPPPKGPGLPPLEELLTEAPPITEAMLRSLLPPPPPAPLEVPEEEDEDAALAALPPQPAPPKVPLRGIAAIELVAGERPLVLVATALAAPPAAAALPAGTPGRWLQDAAVSLDPAGVVQAETLPAGTPAAVEANPADLALALRMPGGQPPTRMFIEAVLALFVMQRAFLPHLRPARIYVGRAAWAAGPSDALEPQLLAVLFPGIRVLADLAGDEREARVLLVDASQRNAATDTLIGGMMPHVARHTVEARQRIFAAFGLPATAEPPLAPGRRPQALFLHSAPPRALADPVRERLVAMLRRTYDVRYVDVANLEWRRQVRLGCGADLIVGAHSPAMAAVLWGHPQARVLEFFPEGTRRYDGQLLAEAAALAYLGLEGVAERGFVIRARERWGPPAGDANRLVWALPWAMLEQALAARPAVTAAPTPTVPAPPVAPPPEAA